MRVLAQVETAVNARLTFIQLREKRLPTRTLYELAARANALVTRARAGHNNCSSLHHINTRLLVNDRADVAFAAGCDGVHLTTQSVTTAHIRRAFGDDFLIGVSTHTLAEARRARDEGANFAVFGPVFETASKKVYGAPVVGLNALNEAARALSPFPLIALGGIINTTDHTREVFKAGAGGVAAIRLFGESKNLQQTVREIQDVWGEIDRTDAQS